MKIDISFERLNSKNFLVKFERKHWWSKKKKLLKEEIMSEDELQDFIKESGVAITKIESNQHNGFNDTLNRYMKFKKEGTSLAGERVIIKNIRATYVDEEEDVRATIFFDVIGATSNKLIGHKKVELYPLSERAKDGGLEIVFPNLFQLYYSGCHATKEDELQCVEAIEQLNQSHKK
jgi:hypothetical protein